MSHIAICSVNLEKMMNGTSEVYVVRYPITEMTTRNRKIAKSSGENMDSILFWVLKRARTATTIPEYITMKVRRWFS